MFQELEGMLQKVATGSLDQQSVGQAAEQHVNSMDSSELTQHVQTAADNAQQSGNSDLASQLGSMLEQATSNPQGFKSDVIAFIKNNPQVLQHFAPQFARGILGSL